MPRQDRPRKNRIDACIEVQWRRLVAIYNLSSRTRPCIDYAGHINHTLFWANLAPTSASGGQLSSGLLNATIESDFGSVGDFKTKFNAATAAIQGSGWGWLVRQFLCAPTEVLTERLVSDIILQQRN
jgi:hypothetical protein